MALQVKVRTSVTNAELTPESCSLIYTQTHPDMGGGIERDRDRERGRRERQRDGREENKV